MVGRKTNTQTIVHQDEVCKVCKYIFFSKIGMASVPFKGIYFSIEFFVFFSVKNSTNCCIQPFLLFKYKLSSSNETNILNLPIVLTKDLEATSVPKLLVAELSQMTKIMYGLCQLYSIITQPLPLVCVHFLFECLF